MSEKDKHEAAVRRGRADFYRGVAYEDCPLRAGDSIMDWQKAWKKEKAEFERTSRTLGGTPRPCIMCGKATCGSHICPACLDWEVT